MKIAILVIFVSLSTSLYSQDTQEVSELTSLRASWTRARQEALKPIDIKYETALRTLKDKLAKSGKLYEAIQVDTEIKNIVKDSEKPVVVKANVKDELVGRWECTSSNGWRGIFHFLPNGKIGETGARWVISQDNKKLYLKGTDGKDDTFDLPPVDGVITGLSSRTNDILKATKIKE